jgi:hypothetical protein
MVVRGQRSLERRLLQDRHHQWRGPLEVRLSRVANVIYGNVQWLGHQHCTTGHLGEHQPC